MDAPKAGTKLQDADTGVEAIVVKPPSGGIEIRPASGDGVALGKRYTCGECEAELLVTKAGNGELVCHDGPMGIAQPKTLPSSD